MIVCKSESELAAMRVSGRMAAVILQRLAAAVVPGMTTRELDEMARALIRYGKRLTVAGNPRSRRVTSLWKTRVRSRRKSTHRKHPW